MGVFVCCVIWWSLRQQIIEKINTICQRLDDSVTKSICDIHPAMQYLFQLDHKLCTFCGIFGRTMTFGKCSCHPTVGDTKYLQHFEIINFVIPSSLEAVKAGKGNGIVLCFDGKDLVVKVHYHKFIYQNTNRLLCPCPVLNAAIKYSVTVAAANHGASVLQIDLLFHVNDMILEIIAFGSDHVEAAIISPSLCMGEILQYNREFVAQQGHEYICLI